MLRKLLLMKVKLETSKTQPHKLLSRFPKYRLSTQLDKVCRKLVELLVGASLQGLTLTKMSWLGDASALNSNPDYFYVYNTIQKTQTSLEDWTSIVRGLDLQFWSSVHHQVRGASVFGQAFKIFFFAVGELFRSNNLKKIQITWILPK